jgi:hypothetical protein
VCVLKEACSSRTPISGNENVCGPGCVKIESDDKCGDECVNPSHYEANEESGGVCELKECASRIVEDGLEFVCGYDNADDSEFCVKNEKSKECAASCDNPSHFKNDTSNVCVEKSDCAQRTANRSSERVCGSGDCYLTEGDEGICSTSCDEPRLEEESG